MSIRWSDGALRNLEAIRSYIAADNATAVATIVLRMFDEVARLRTHPNLGRPGRAAGTRELLIRSTPFIVPYTVRDDTIVILRVLHTSQRWPDTL